MKQPCWSFEVYSDEEKNAFLDVNNPQGPYYGFKGNSNTIKRLQRIDFSALDNVNHFTELNVALFGPPGVGKTDLAKRHNKARQLPFVEISPKAVKTPHGIFQEIKRVLAIDKIPLVDFGFGHYEPPPLDIFIDEVHALSGTLVQSLLTATEPKTFSLNTEKGVKINCKNIHWIIATTDRGRLFDAFDTRFIKCNLHYYNKETLAQIVHTHNPDFSLDICRLVVSYCSKIPRETLAFVREMKLERRRNPQAWEIIAARIAEESDIDPHGMPLKALAILKALKDGPIAEKRLPIVTGGKMEELNKFVLPWLLERIDDEEPFVTVTTKGYDITENGMNELKRRGL